MLTAAFVLGVIISDQASKYLAIRFLAREPGGHITVFGNFFSLSLVYNSGGAFGLFPRHTPFFIVLSLLIITLLLLYYRRFFRHGLNFRISSGLILGGAVGNLIDRIRYNYVVDFLDFDFFDLGIPPFKIFSLRFPGYYLDRWPAFNIADSAICVGVILLIAAGLFQKKSKTTDAPTSF